jgi:hypothetical protein
MSDLVETIRTALVSDASAEARTAGAAACRCVLAMIEPPQAPVLSPDAVPQLVAMLGRMDLDQVLGVAIDRLRAVNAARGDIGNEQKPRSIAFQLVPVPRALNGGG